MQIKMKEIVFYLFLKFYLIFNNYDILIFTFTITVAIAYKTKYENNLKYNCNYKCNY